MNDLDAEWNERLRQAQERAREAGRGDVADYLFLRAANDMARATGIQWLLEAFTALSGEANRAGSAIAISRDESHRFQVGNSTMVGTKLTFSVGVRALMIEAGWPRTPRDGIVRGGGLACARINHFGNRAASEELLLTQRSDTTPQWLVLEATGTRTNLTEDRIRRHIGRLIDNR